jgi:hypothetical protein
MSFHLHSTELLKQMLESSHYDEKEKKAIKKELIKRNK